MSMLPEFIKTGSICVALCQLLLSACASHQPLPASWEQVPAELDIAWHKAQRFTPQDAEQDLYGDWVRPVGPDRVPAVLMVHGGGWSSRSREDMRASAERFARAGFGVFNISHRFAPKFTYPAQLTDLQAAVSWMRQNADPLGLDSDWIAGYGYSSGAHLIALLGVLDQDSPHYQADTGLQALVLGGAPTDLRRFQGGKLIPQFLGTDFENGFPVYAEASPVTHLSPDDPPTFLYHGGMDALVSADYAREFSAAAMQAGVPTELYIAPLHGHVSMFLLRAGAEQKAIRFLLGQVPAGPTRD